MKNFDDPYIGEITNQYVVVISAALVLLVCRKFGVGKKLLTSLIFILREKLSALKLADLDDREVFEAAAARFIKRN